LDAILRDRPEARLSQLRGDLLARVELVDDALYGEMVRSGYFHQNPRETERRYLRAGLTLLAVVGIGGLVWYLGIRGVAPLAFLPVFAAAAVAASLIWISRYMPKKTDKGSAAAAKWAAFRRYLANIENYRELAEARDQFETYLPYAIAFGLETVGCASTGNLANAVAAHAARAGLASWIFIPEDLEIGKVISTAVFSVPSGTFCASQPRGHVTAPSRMTM
jgi:hypothetical protein